MVAATARSRRFANHLATWLVAAFVSGCLAPPELAPKQAPANAFELRKDRALFWEGTRSGEAKPRLYVLGSVHVLDQPLVLGPELTRAFESSEALVLEIDLSSVQPEEIARQLAIYGELGLGEQLEDVIGEDVLAMLDRWFTKRGVAVQERSALKRAQPWVIAMHVTQVMYAELGARLEFGVDQYFLQLADERTRVLGLETLGEQFLALSSHSPSVQEEMLRASLDEGPDAFDVASLLAAWKRGDAEALEALTFEDEEDNQELYETIFYARNHVMSERIVELLDAEPDTTYFVVVGTGHLVGKDNVIALLGAEGYRMQRGH